MILRTRKFVVTAVVVIVLLLAHVDVVVGGLDTLGLIGVAAHVREHFLTGTGITVIAVIVFLATPDRQGRLPRFRFGRCPVCGVAHARRACYCGACGSHL